MIEEVARHFGFDKFPPRLHAVEAARRAPAARRSRRSPARAPDRPRLSRNRHDSAGERRGRRAVPRSESVDAGARRQSSGRGCFAAALERPGQHGARAGLESQSRPAQRAPVRNRPRLRHGRRRAARRRASSRIGATGLAREKGVAESQREYEFADLKGDLDQIGELAGGFAWIAPSAARRGKTPRARGRLALAGKRRPSRRADRHRRQSSRSASPTASSFARMFFWPSFSSILSTRAYRWRVPRDVTSRSRASRRSSAISR